MQVWAVDGFTEHAKVSSELRFQFLNVRFMLGKVIFYSEYFI